VNLAARPGNRAKGPLHAGLVPRERRTIDSRKERVLRYFDLFVCWVAMTFLVLSIACTSGAGTTTGAPPYGAPSVPDPGTGAPRQAIPCDGSCDCAAGSCVTSCESSPCTVDCPSGDCASTCAEEGSCTIDCAGGRCLTYCGEDTCAVDCSSGHCNTSCPSGATCAVDCSGGGCLLACGPGATCSVGCSAGNCTELCATGATCSFTDCPAASCACTGAGCSR
jgi:hypothetical protein